MMLIMLLLLLPGVEPLLVLLIPGVVVLATASLAGGQADILERHASTLLSTNEHNPIVQGVRRSRLLLLLGGCWQRAYLR